MADAAATEEPWADVADGDVLGDDAFRQRIAAHLPAAAGSDPEIPRRRRHPARPALATLRAADADRGTWMTAAYRAYGYTMAEIAAEAGLHYSSVSKIIKAREAAGSQFKT